MQDKFISFGYIKFSEEDNWENGCNGNVSSYVVDHNICGTKEEIIRQIQDTTGEISTDSFVFNSCDENGRIDVMVQENENGERLTESEWRQFKSGEINTYLCTYSFQFYQLSEVTF